MKKTGVRLDLCNRCIEITTELHWNTAGIWVGQVGQFPHRKQVAAGVFCKHYNAGLCRLSGGPFHVCDNVSMSRQFLFYYTVYTSRQSKRGPGIQADTRGVLWCYFLCVSSVRGCLAGLLSFLFIPIILILFVFLDIPTTLTYYFTYNHLPNQYHIFNHAKYPFILTTIPSTSHDHNSHHFHLKKTSRK